MRQVPITDELFVELGFPRGSAKGYDNYWHLTWVDGRRLRRQLRRAGKRA